MPKPTHLLQYSQAVSVTPVMQDLPQCIQVCVAGGWWDVAGIKEAAS